MVVYKCIMCVTDTDSSYRVHCKRLNPFMPKAPARATASDIWCYLVLSVVHWFHECLCLV